MLLMIDIDRYFFLAAMCDKLYVFEGEVGAGR